MQTEHKHHLVVATCSHGKVSILHLVSRTKVKDRFGWHGVREGELLIVVAVNLSLKNHTIPRGGILNATKHGCRTMKEPASRGAALIGCYGRSGRVVLTKGRNKGIGYIITRT